MLDHMRDQMIAAIESAAAYAEWSVRTIGEATWFQVRPGRADRIILQNARFTASSPIAIRILDCAIREVQDPQRVGNTLRYVSLETGVEVEVSLVLLEAIRVLIAPETRENQSVDQETLATATRQKLVKTGDDEHHVILTTVGCEAMAIARLLQS